jgi:hypothetical protein
LHDGVYHPHTLSVRNGEFYFCESHEGAFRSVEKVLFKFNGYARGVEWLSDQLVCVATSIGRKVSKSTGLFSSPADQGQTAGQCMLTINNIDSGKTEQQLDLSWFGPEMYDVILLSGQYDLLEFSRHAHLAERNALDKKTQNFQKASRQLEKKKQTAQNQAKRLQNQSKILQQLSRRLEAREWNLQKFIRVKSGDWLHFFVESGEYNDDKCSTKYKQAVQYEKSIGCYPY